MVGMVQEMEAILFGSALEKGMGMVLFSPSVNCMLSTACMGHRKKCGKPTHMIYVFQSSSPHVFVSSQDVEQGFDALEVENTRINVVAFNIKTFVTRWN